MKELDQDNNARRIELGAIMKAIIDTKVRMHHHLSIPKHLGRVVHSDAVITFYC